jgi:hypothetical protein
VAGGTDFNVGGYSGTLAATGRPQKEPTMPSDETPGTGPERHPVLEVFGLKLEVSNPRLAELLTTDARDVLGTGPADVTTVVPQRSDDPDPLADDLLLANLDPEADLANRLRRETRARVNAIAAGLGFEASEDGRWTGPMGHSVATRIVERAIDLEAATRFVEEVSRVVEGAPGSSLLFVATDAHSVDTLATAISARRFVHIMRCVHIDDLVALRTLHTSGAASAVSIAALLIPAAAIDAGTLIRSLAESCDAAEENAG